MHIAPHAPRVSLRLHALSPRPFEVGPSVLSATAAVCVVAMSALCCSGIPPCAALLRAPAACAAASSHSERSQRQTRAASACDDLTTARGVVCAVLMHASCCMHCQSFAAIAVADPALSCARTRDTLPASPLRTPSHSNSPLAACRPSSASASDLRSFRTARCPLSPLVPLLIQPPLSRPTQSMLSAVCSPRSRCVRVVVVAACALPRLSPSAF